ncbi:MAG: hypothetical protein HPY79_12475 [Bacteroidales bacterium]|nr:hypothetical protein [Bacteroidales bacterium]
MKTSKNIITITLISIFIFISCIKKSNINYVYDNYLYNATNDTLVLKFHYIYNTNSKSVLYPKRLYGDFREMLYKLQKIEIFKYNDTNNLYIAFYKENEPYNYKTNIFDFPSAWNYDTTITWYLVKFTYSYSINYNDIINK